MTFANMLRAVHYQDVDPGTQWIKDAAVAIDSNGPLDPAPQDQDIQRSARRRAGPARLAVRPCA